MQLRLTPAGIGLAGRREQETTDTLAGIDWAGIANDLSA